MLFPWQGVVTVCFAQAGEVGVRDAERSPVLLHEAHLMGCAAQLGVICFQWFPTIIHKWENVAWTCEVYKWLISVLVHVAVAASQARLAKTGPVCGSIPLCGSESLSWTSC